MVISTSNLATLDVGFQPGMSYRYQLTAAVQSGDVCIETDPVQSGLATPIVPVLLTFPANQAGSIDLRAFAPTFTSRAGADLFQLEVSTDPTFKNAARIYRTQIISTSPNTDGVSQSLPQPLDLTTRPELLADAAFANFVNHVANAAAPTIYWRVGARHDEDVPGPVHFISQNPNDPDRTFRFVYAATFNFIPR